MSDKPETKLEAADGPNCLRRHIARLYRDDVHPDAIAAITGRHQATIRRLLYKLGLKPKPDVGPNGGRPRLS